MGKIARPISKNHSNHETGSLGACIYSVILIVDAMCMVTIYCIVGFFDVLKFHKCLIFMIYFHEWSPKDKILVNYIPQLYGNVTV